MDFLHGKQIIVFFSASVNSLLRFLTAEFDRGASYGPLNCFRSAITLFPGPHISQDPVRRFFKGVFNLRPSRFRYSHIWDPVIVLDYISFLGSRNL